VKAHDVRSIVRFQHIQRVFSTHEANVSAVVFFPQATKDGSPTRLRISADQNCRFENTAGEKELPEILKLGLSLHLSLTLVQSGQEKSWSKEKRLAKTPRKG
jgi:hypothetical protein